MQSSSAAGSANGNQTAGTEVALLAGATGMVGNLCCQRLLAGGAFAEVVTVGRRAPAEGPGVRRARALLAELGAIEQQPPVAATAALCALGTTMKKAGSEAAFRAVDHDAVVAFARWARRGGASRFVLVSSVGADLRARSFYLRVKGEVEAAVAKLGFARLVILRPSMLLGPRPENRPGEALARAVLPAMAPLLRGGFRRYRAIGAETVAAAMVTAGTRAEPGLLIWEHDEIEAAAGEGALPATPSPGGGDAASPKL